MASAGSGSSTRRGRGTPWSRPACARRTVDAVLGDLRRQGVPDPDIELARVELVGSLATGRPEVSLVWADVIGTAWLNARPIARYLAFMLVAGVIAAYGVIDDNVILIVGAMAVSPDLLPITGIGVGVVARLPGLAIRAFLTLALGLGAASRRSGRSLRAGPTRPPTLRLRPRASRRARRAHDRQQRDDRGCSGGRRGRDAGARDSRQLRSGRGHLGDDDPRLRLLRRRGGPGRVREGDRRARGARGERPDDGGGRSRHARASGSARAPPPPREKRAAAS